MRTTNIKFTGLASGLDTGAMVEAMIAPHKLKVDKSYQERLMMEMKRDKYKEVSQLVNTFYTKFAGNYRLEASFNKVKVTSSSSAVTINSGSTSGTNTINSVTALASSAKLSTTSIGAKKSDTLGSLGIGLDSDTISLKVDTGTKDEDGNTVYATVDLLPEKTIEGLEKELKKAMPNVNISYDNIAKGFFVSSKGTGANQKISIVAERTTEGGVTTEAPEILTTLGLGIGKATGGNAEIVFNDMPISSETNTLTINGMNITLNSTVDGSTPVTLTGVQDTDEAFEYVKEFVTEYNKLLEQLNTLIEAPKNREYQPLTEEQKKEMSAEDIKLWNEKIEKSLLANDPVLKKLVNDMRGIMAGVIEGDGYNLLADIGIATGNWKENGILHIDEKKLRQALETNPEAVAELFAGKEGKSGLVDNLYSKLSESFKAVKNIKSTTSIFSDIALTKKITEEAKREDKLKESMARAEAMYSAKFVAMEKMMQQLNSQGSWLSSQMGGM